MSETRKDTKPLCGFQDRCSPSEPYCGQTPCAYHEAVVREAEQTLRDHAPHLLAAATPPTPDRAAVREALVRVRSALARHDARVSGGTMRQTRCVVTADALDVDDVRALLAAVSRPAEARGEADYLALTDRNGHILTTRKASEGAENILAQFPADEFPNHAPFTLVPLCAHPAPSGGEVEKCEFCGAVGGYHYPRCDAAPTSRDAAALAAREGA